VEKFVRIYCRNRPVVAVTADSESRMFRVVLLQRVIPLATDRCDWPPPHLLMDSPTEYATVQDKERNKGQDFHGRKETEK
jgi:hypothetical protein